MADLTGLGSVAELANNLVNRFIPDKAQAEKDQASAELQSMLAQIAANTAAASQPGMHFRDGAGWVCVVAMGFNFVLRPMIEWASTIAQHAVILPQLDTSQTTPMLLSLLGLGGLHAYQAVRS